MANDVAKDQFVIIRVEGMHCHKCEQKVKSALSQKPGVHEVEVDFNSGQASVLFDPSAMNIPELVESVNQSGYRATGFTKSDAEPH